LSYLSFGFVIGLVSQLVACARVILYVVVHISERWLLTTPDSLVVGAVSDLLWLGRYPAVSPTLLTGQREAA
jgi:hypothetical protein